MSRDDQDVIFAAIGFFFTYAVPVAMGIMAHEEIKWWPVGIPFAFASWMLLFSFVWRKR